MQPRLMNKQRDKQGDRTRAGDSNDDFSRTRLRHTGTHLHRGGDAQHRRRNRERARGHFSDARCRAHRQPHPQAVRHRQSGAFWLVPPVPGRDRRQARHAGLVHHAGGSRHGGAHAQHPACRSAPRRDGALYLRPPARLPDLLRQWQLRAAGHGRRGRPARSALRHGGAQPFRCAQRGRARRLQPLLQLRRRQVHRVQPLRARLR